MSIRLSRRQFVGRTAAAAGVAAAGLGFPTIVKAAQQKWGDLKGRFVYDGKPPERKKLTVDKDVECCGKFDIRDESLMVGQDGALQNVYVYVRSRTVDVRPELAETAAKQVTLDNRDCIFVPHCLNVWYAKQELLMVNTDPVAQNIAFSPLGDVPANLIIPAADESKKPQATWKFKRKQIVPVPIKCNYHPWESAHILPLAHPYAAVSQQDGTFQIASLPVGELEFQVWHERIGYLATPSWTRGRFKMAIRPGTNDLGTVKLDPSLLEKK